MRFLGKILISGISVFVAAIALSGVSIDSYWAAIIVALVLAFLNSFVKPLLIMLTIPFTIISFGLFLLVINALIILLADAMISGFYVDGFWWALAFSLILSILTSVFSSPFRRADTSSERDQ